MDFSGDMGLIQRRVAEGPEGIARRMAVYDSLAPRRGQAILDLGCGGGHLLRDVALAVGVEGRAIGLDISQEQLDAARTACDGLASVELIRGDATAIPLADGELDALTAIQTLEYIEDVNSALAESRRVLRPGARVALVSVLWDHWTFHGADPALTQRMLDCWRSHCRHQMLPLELPGRLAVAGFGGVARRPIAFLNGELHENAYAFWAAKIVAAFAVANGIAEDEAQGWLDQLAEADREGRFGFVSVPVLTVATAL